jgi:tyrosine-protein kinase Etk/Wzc
MERKRSSILVILQSLISHRRMIIINVFAVTVAAIIISLVLPKWYKATVVILPPEKSESLSELAMSVGLQSLALSGSGFALPVMASPSDLIAAIAESRTVAERVVDTLDLANVYGVRSRGDAVSILQKQTSVHVRSEGIIEITYVDKDKNLVASVANSIAAELDNINRLTKVQKARDLKRFVQEELEKNNVNLTKAENALQEFQRKNKAIALDDQTSASIKAAADIYSQLTLDQIDLKVLEKSHSANHPDVIALKYKISEMEKRLDQLQGGNALQDDTSGSFLSIPFSDLPELSLRYMQLVRDLKREEALHEVLNTQLEQAKIMEAKDTPTISVLDWALPPSSKFKPRRIMIVLTAFILTFAFSMIYAVFLDRWHEFKISSPDKYQDISSVLGVLKKDLLGFRKKAGHHS